MVHLITQLLATDKYIIRGTARSAQKKFETFPNETKTVFEIPNSTSDHTEVLDGVQTVLHLAAPVYNRVENGEVLFNVCSSFF